MKNNKKVKLTKEKFLDWYFSDTDDYDHINNRLFNSLLHYGKFSINVRELLDSCCELPERLMEGYDEENDKDYHYVPCEIELI